MKARRSGFTMVEILVSIAILAILFGLMFRPLLMGIEILSIGRSEKRAQSTARDLVARLGQDLQNAIKVYPNTATFDLVSSGSPTRWRTPQTARIDILPPARDAAGRLLTPVRPAYLNGDPTQPLVITWWLMREDPDKDYDPQTNPRMIWRAIHSFQVPGAVAASSVANTFFAAPSSPDDLWRYGLQVALDSGQSLDAIAPDLFSNATYRMFQQLGGPFNWFITDTERSSYIDTGDIMRAPGAASAATHAKNLGGTDVIGAITPLTDRETDIREFRVLPVRSDVEELVRNDNATAYKGRYSRWIQPYERSSDGLWTLPSNGLIVTTGGSLPLVAMLRPAGTRDGGGPLGEQYFVSIVQDPASGRVGHPLLYRLQSDTTLDPIPVYDLTEYPRRVFGATPGTTGGAGELSGEMACGISWETGEITTVFQQTDVIAPLPAGGAINPAVYAADSYELLRMAPANALPSALTGDAPDWLTLPLTWLDAAGAPAGSAAFNGSMLDDFVLDRRGAPSGVWDSYTLSVFRPQRLHTDTGVYADAALFSGTETVDPRVAVVRRRLNMSIVPGSVKVVVEQRSTANVNSDPNTWPVVRRVSYTPVRAMTPGAMDSGALEPFRFNVDESSGRLTFYDPQLDLGAITARDGLNPPAVLIDAAGTVLVPFVFVTYEYRNNLPTIDQLQLGDDANADSVVCTYRSTEAVEMKLQVDVPAESTRGEGETFNDPLAATAIDRPTGARRRVEVTSTVRVGGGR